MTKSELILRLAELNPNLYHRDIERIVNCFFDTITDALAEGKRVELRGFGAFSVRHRDARQGAIPAPANPLTLTKRKSRFSKWANPCWNVSISHRPHIH
jgi:integration host factor subunit beta